MTRRVSVTRWWPVICAALAGLLSAAEPDRPAAHWPQWRGPNRDGTSVEKGLLQTWDKEGPALEWKTSGLGEGFASVVIAEGRIFTMGKRDGQELLLALDSANGRVLWSAKVGAATLEPPNSTPTVDGDRVFALGASGDLICVESASGKERWRKSYATDFGGSFPTWRFCESLLVDGEKLVCTPGSADAALAALDKSTGDVLWKCAIANLGTGGGYSSAVISTGAWVRQYVQLLGEGAGCVGVAANDGRLLWSYSRVANKVAGVPTPIIDGDHVFCTSGYGTGAALLQLEKSPDGVRANEVHFLSGSQFFNHHGGMVRVGQYVYAGHGDNGGIPVCIDLKTGAIRWKARGPGTGSAAVAYADGQLYFRYQNGLMALIGATPERFQLNGTFSFPQDKNESFSHPVIAGGKLYLREWDSLLVYRLSKP